MTELTNSQRIAIAAAVVKILTAEDGAVRADVGRRPGSAWTQDHLRMRFGRSPRTRTSSWQWK